MALSIAIKPRPQRHASQPAATTFAPPTKKIEMFTASHDNREIIENYIAQQFLLSHRATIRYFMPTLLSLSQGNKTLAALGLQTASAQPLFLQQYLDRRIDRCIATKAKTPVHLNQIVEIGNLVATQAGASQLLFILLTQVLSLAGYEWVAFTGTPVVKKSLERFGFEFHSLGEATIDHLAPVNQLDWGSYYEQRPMVLAGNISSGIRQLSTSRWSSTLALYRDEIAALAAAVRRTSGE